MQTPLRGLRGEEKGAPDVLSGRAGRESWARSLWFLLLHSGLKCWTVSASAACRSAYCECGEHRNGPSPSVLSQTWGEWLLLYAKFSRSPSETSLLLDLGLEANLSAAEGPLCILLACKHTCVCI